MHRLVTSDANVPCNDVNENADVGMLHLTFLAMTYLNLGKSEVYVIISLRPSYGFRFASGRNEDYFGFAFF